MADNKIALNAEWDQKLLEKELADLGGFDLSLTGFDFGELEKLLEPPTKLFDSIAPDKKEAQGTKPASGSVVLSDIKMVQLFFTSKQEEIFKKTVNAYMIEKNVNNLTDAVFEMVMGDRGE